MKNVSKHRRWHTGVKDVRENNNLKWKSFKIEFNHNENVVRTHLFTVYSVQVYAIQINNNQIQFFQYKVISPEISSPEFTSTNEIANG